MIPRKQWLPNTIILTHTYELTGPAQFPARWILSVERRRWT